MMVLRLMVILAVTGAALCAGADGPFSHRKHAPLKLKCTFCHTGAEKQERALFPTVAQCKTCHPTMLERRIPSARVYKVKDFVMFSHARHIAAKAECRDCHGDVFGMERVVPARATTMIACVDCHKERHATQQCNACHELGQ
ncbi:MAG: cytochrome c3 family protein [Acidobacteria bacterium]|nr:cytochrome c3 family protein [Acidobacteriota bacterium]